MGPPAIRRDRLLGPLSFLHEGIELLYINRLNQMAAEPSFITSANIVLHGKTTQRYAEKTSGSHQELPIQIPTRNTSTPPTIT